MYIYIQHRIIYTPNAGTRAPTFCNLLLHVDTAATHHPIPAAALNIILCPPECATRSYYYYYYTTRTIHPAQWTLFPPVNKNPVKLAPAVFIFLLKTIIRRSIMLLLCVILCCTAADLWPTTHHLPLSPRIGFSGVLNIVGENVLTVYADLYTPLAKCLYYNMYWLCTIYSEFNSLRL